MARSRWATRFCINFITGLACAQAMKSWEYILENTGCNIFLVHLRNRIRRTFL